MNWIREAVFTSAFALAMAAGCAPTDADEPEADAPDGEHTVASAPSSAEAASKDELGSSSQALHYGFLPHNQPRTFTSLTGCRVVVQHGNFWAAAYAKVDVLTPGCAASVSVTAAQNGQLVGASGGVVGEADGWTQAQVSWANIIGSDVLVVAGNFDSWSLEEMHFAGL